MHTRNLRKTLKTKVRYQPTVLLLPFSLITFKLKTYFQLNPNLIYIACGYLVHVFACLHVCRFICVSMCA